MKRRMIVSLRCRRAAAASKGDSLTCGHPSRLAEACHRAGEAGPVGRLALHDDGGGCDGGGEGECDGSGGRGGSGRGGSRHAPALRPAIIQ